MLDRGFLALMHRYLLVRGVTSHEVTLDGHRVHYYALEGQGEGPPVLLVHGLAGNAGGFASMFFPLAKRFSRVVAVDLPGNGFSPIPSLPMPLLNQSQLLDALCEAVMGGAAFVLANSLGGALALQF